MNWRTLFLLPLLWLNAAYPAAPAPAPATSELGPDTTLRVAAAHLDSLLEQALSSLQFVALTPEARAGDWPGIKRYLRPLAARLPGVYFYVLPNGDYFSLARDFTNLNLRDRPYFRPLFAGNPIKGFPIYSRSSGKKSVLLAAPITHAGVVTGALGVSVFLDELHTYMNQTLDLPPNYTWFVLDVSGNTLLDRDSEFIFKNALDEGGASLHDAVTVALQHNHGSVDYEYDGGVRHARYQRLPTMEWWMLLAEKDPAETAAPARLALSLERLVPDLQQRLNRLDSASGQLAQSQPIATNDERQVRALLRKALELDPAVVNVAFVDRPGTLRQIEPTDYRNFENVDISTQAHVIAMRTNPQAVFSGSFTSVEGFLAVDLAYPLYDHAQQFVGSLSMLLRPESLLTPLLKRDSIPADYELWVMQPDGLIVFDQDTNEIGRSLFNDPLYAGFASLRKLGRAIATQPSGDGRYLFYETGSHKEAVKQATWQTVSLHNREWRVVLTRRPYQ